MALRWSLFEFDWNRFQRLAPRLKAAWRTGDFTAFESPDELRALARFDEGATAEDICNALVVELCSTGEALIFEVGLPALALWFRRRAGGEELSETLGGLLSAESNISPWFRSRRGLVGILNPTQTAELAAAFSRFRPLLSSASRRGAMASFLRLLRTTDPAAEQILDLAALVDRAAAENHGLAATVE
jgi:hypothetical protein